MTARDTSADTDRKRWSALLVCLAGGFMVFLDVSIVNVALPMISVHLHASGSGLQWIVSGYALAFGLLLVSAGRLGDIHGHRMLFVVGLAVFVAASAACGAAPTATFLVIGRIAQGAAGGVLTPQISATIQQLFQGADRGRAFGYFASVAAVSSAIGPLAGGALLAGRQAAPHGRDLIAAGLLLMLAGFLGSALAVGLVPRHGTGWATLAPTGVAPRAEEGNGPGTGTRQKLLAARMAPDADRGGRPARRRPRSACPASNASGPAVNRAVCAGARRSVRLLAP